MTLTERESITSTSNDGQGTFNFLGLPAELRGMIYHYHLTAERILPLHPFLAKRWTPINLLYVCRTIYDEAFFHLYTKGEFVLAIRPENIFGPATCRETDDISGSVAFGLSAKSAKIHRIIRHIALDIYWPSLEYAVFMSSDDTPSANELLRHNMATVGNMLSPLPSLRTIDISWLQMTLRVDGLEEIAPPGYKIPGWLRGLKQVRRRSNEKVLIRMPAKGPISTEQLERDQRDMGEESNILREMREDVAEMLGVVTELGHL